MTSNESRKAAGNPYEGLTSLDDWLDEEGVREEVTERAEERVERLRKRGRK